MKFREYPYRGWLYISLVLWCFNFIHFYAHRAEMMPVKMANAVNKDLQNNERAFDDFTKEKALISRLYNDSLSAKEIQKINALPFYLYAYDDDTLAFWNNNSVIGLKTDTVQADVAIRRNLKGVFVRKYGTCAGLYGNKKLVALFPVVIQYPLENDYLHAHFTASDNIPVKTKISDQATGAPDEYPILMKGNKCVGYLELNKNDIQRWRPDALLLIMLLMSVLTSIAWIQLMVLHLTRKYPPTVALIILIGIILVCKLLQTLYGLPFHLDTLTIFSPSLYGSSIYLSSLGDLFIYILYAIWLLVFVSRHTTYKSYCDRMGKGPVSILLGVLLQIALVALCCLFIEIIASLILDSRISFDVTHFYAISTYTVFGLLAIICITSIMCMFIYLINLQLGRLIPSNWFRYVMFALLCYTIFTFFHPFHERFLWYMCSSILAFLILLDIPSFTLTSKLFEPRMIVWALIICCGCTAIVRYFNDVKEQLSRRAFVEQHLTPHRDDYMEFSFYKTAKSIEQDKSIKNFFLNPTLSQRKTIDQHMEVQYLAGPLNKYQVRLYLFDAKYGALFNKDTAGYAALVNEKSESVLTNSSYLFYKESILDRHYYLSYIPIYNDSSTAVIGYVIIDLDLKKETAGTVYPELLQPQSSKTNTGENEYAYAVYINDKLITQTNNYAFPVRLKNDTLQNQNYIFTTSNGVNTLFYKIADKRTVAVVHYHNEFIEAVTLFSYLFGIQIIIALIIFIYQLYLSYAAGEFFKGKYIRLTLRRRVHLSMLTVVFISFAIIGYTTIQFFSKEYRTTNENKFENALQTAKQSVQDYLTKKSAYTADYIFDTVSKSAGFKYAISSLANNQKIDINIFDNNGDLFATSQEEIYDKGLISRKMRPEAFFELNHEGKSLVIQNEKVGGLSYVSAYQPLRDERGVTLGYINVPFFSSEKDLDFQISNILVTLINLYAFIFLLSGLLTVIVTRRLTRSFDIIIRQFDKLNLEQNERIVWPYDDEIGKLVKTYNKMVKKVEENAARLAQSERESAWREMARQVAHEIKNPLTPMKLNIQYLRQAMRNDNANIKQLTEHLSESIIEQIDNLSYIASEFSNFAKMPEAKPEDLELGDLLKNAVQLYNSSEGIKVTLKLDEQRVCVVSDKSQLLRVFTNLLENAKQAIPPGKDGIIDVTLSCPDNSILITITDNGTGIDEEVSKKIFQPYFTTKSSGTGLGLAMTKKIIEFWKGEIWFETKEGVGTTFFIRLPLG